MDSLGFHGLEQGSSGSGQSMYKAARRRRQPRTAPSAKVVPPTYNIAPAPQRAQYGSKQSGLKQYQAQAGTKFDYYGQKDAAKKSKYGRGAPADSASDSDATSALQKQVDDLQSGMVREIALLIRRVKALEHANALRDKADQDSALAAAVTAATGGTDGSQDQEEH